MCFGIYDTEGLPDVEALAILLLDASGTMSQTELKSHKYKHECAGRMVQEVINRMDEPHYADAYLTVACFSADTTEVRILPLLDAYHPYGLKTYTGGTNYGLWDPLSPEHRNQGMGGKT